VLKVDTTEEFATAIAPLLNHPRPVGDIAVMNLTTAGVTLTAKASNNQPSTKSGQVHIGCLYCTNGSGSGCHRWCGSFSGSSQTKAIYEKLVEAAQRGDASRMLKLAAGAPDFVAVNRDRMAVQLRSCQLNGVLASVPIPQTDVNTRRIAMLERLQAERTAFAVILNRIRTSAGVSGL
jgi:hypothetical protein